MKNRSVGSLAMFGVLLSSGFASAQVSIQNGSFETPDTPYQQVVPTGWSNTGQGVFLWESGAYVAPADGNQVLILEARSPNHSLVYQNVGNLDSATDYTMSFYVGSQNDPVNVPDRAGNWFAEFRTGATFATSSQLARVDYTTETAGLGVLAQKSLLLDDVNVPSPLIGQPLFVVLGTFGVSSGLTQALFDNATLTAVPEPATVAFLAVAGGAALLRRRRMRA